MALGYELGPWGPFALLKRLPLYSALRYPERYLIVVALVVAVGAANGVRLFEIAARRRVWARAAVALGAVLLIANAVFLLVNFHAVAAERLLVGPPAELARPFRQARGNRWLAAFYAPMSRGSLSCWDAYPVPMSPLLRGDLPEEEYLADSGGRIRHAAALDAELHRPGRRPVEAHRVAGQSELSHRVAQQRGPGPRPRRAAGGRAAGRGPKVSGSASGRGRQSRVPLSSLIALRHSRAGSFGRERRERANPGVETTAQLPRGRLVAAAAGVPLAPLRDHLRA